MADLARSIFVCYRRDDTRHVAGRLRDRLSEEFGPRSVFMDVDTIGPGADFTAVIDEALRSCRIVLVLIGPTWLAGTNASGRRRITDPADHVAVEIATALRHALPVLPILADGARMPARDDLPPPLADLATRNAVRVDHETFGRDSAAVVETVAATLRPYRRAAARRRLVLPLLALGLVILAALGVFVVLPALRSDKVGGRVIGGAGEVSALTTAVRDGQPVAITGGGDGSIRIFDILSGELLGRPLTGHTDYIYSLSTTELNGRTVIVSSGYDGTIRVWDLVTGAVVGQVRAGSDAINVAATDVVDGRPVVVTTTNADKLVVVDLATDQPVGPPLAGHEGGVLDSATGALDGRPVVVTVDGNWKVGAWDLRTGAVVGGAPPCTGSPAAEPIDVLCSLTLAELHRQPVVVINDGATLRASYLATGEALGDPVVTRGDGESAVAAGRFDGRPIVAVGGTDGTIQVWDLEVNGLTPHGPPITVGSQAAVLAVTEVGADPILVACDTYGAVHIWNLHTVLGP
jgi:WD40 repeat protein